MTGTSKQKSHTEATPERADEDAQEPLEGVSDAEVPEATPEEAEEDELNIELNILRDKLAELEDKQLRARAEADNIQRRAARDVENARKFGVERLIRDLVPVIDSLERAVEMARDAKQEDSDPDGIELAAKLLFDTLSRHGVERIFPEGEPFNPEWHEAVAMAPSDDCEENSVLNVVQAGLSLNGRLVRAAKVVVSRTTKQDD